MTLPGRDVQRFPLDYLNRKITEAEWRSLYRDVARVYGWEMYHTKLSWGSEAGYPDDHFWHPVEGISFWVEAKKEREQPTRKQLACHATMRAAGLRVEVWHPHDWPWAVEVLSFGRAVGVV